MSRTKISRVVTALQFEYKDVQKIPDALALVKEEIGAASCPKLIVRKKTFRAMISGFERNQVEATVSCSFKVTPMGEEFCQQREQMYLAIDRGVSKSEIRLRDLSTNSNSTGHLKQKRNNESNRSRLTLTIFI